MADPTSKPNLKFVNAFELIFWEEVYKASISAGEGGLNASIAADRAVERRRERMSESLEERMNGRG